MPDPISGICAVTVATWVSAGAFVLQSLKFARGVAREWGVTVPQLWVRYMSTAKTAGPAASSTANPESPAESDRREPIGPETPVP